MTVSVKAIDALLPQTQCQECGFKGCMPYAEALAQGAAPIDRCPPGGVKTMQALATLLNKEAAPYMDAVKANTRAPAVASIREAECIGCTKCLPACPVDAIIGSAKSMHAIITTECTGCGLCIEPCPMDCIELLPVKALNYDKENARLRFQNKQIRELRRQHEQQQSYREKRQLSQNADNASADREAKQAYILQALSRIKAKKTV